jgi:two-component SAPR family response regulator
MTWRSSTLKCQKCTVISELYDEIRKIDNKVKVCFLTATYSNYEAARKVFPMLNVECYIQKPIEIEDLIKRINNELEQQ